MINVTDWRPAEELTLETNALRAAQERERCLVLTAGPGAGKTEMLAQRADFLLRTGSCRYPQRILAISFKVDASRNLKERVQHRCGYDLATRFDSYTFHAFAKRIIDRFRLLLSGEDALDINYTIGDRRITRKQIQFSDLVPFAIQILTQSTIARNAIRQTYSDIFLDEFQDCTNQQYDLIKISFQNTDLRLTAVGDTKQKIMGWAGAMDGIFESFKEDFEAVPLNLYLNFRSLPRLLRMQNEIIRVLDPAAVMPADQIEGEGGEINNLHFENNREEAENLADRIGDWISIEQIPLSEIAVLVSKQLALYADHLMEALMNREIPFRNEQDLQDISTEPLARLIVDYLACIHGQREPKAWIRLMNQLIPFADDEAQSTARQNFQRFIKEQQAIASLQAVSGETNSKWWNSVRVFLL